MSDGTMSLPQFLFVTAVVTLAILGFVFFMALFVDWASERLADWWTRERR